MSEMSPHDEGSLSQDDLSRMRVRDGITESHSNNGLNAYEHELEFAAADLEGKTVVDLGVGRTNRFQRELAEAGVNAHVIGVSHDLADQYHRHNLNNASPESRGNNMAAVAEVLPFGDESVDMILALYSLTYYTWDPVQAKAWIGEMGRVLKSGGEARIGPVYPDNDLIFGEDNGLLNQYAAESGMTATIIDDYVLVLRKTGVA